MHPACLPLDELRAEVRFETMRGSGPGGQHRNRTETAVRAIHQPTGTRAHASERRSLTQNQREALQRLRLKLAVQQRTALQAEQFAPPAAELPSARWRARQRGARIEVSPRHEDFAALLAEALDVVAFCDDDVARAARLLQTTTAQLVRFLRRQPEALAGLNERRRRRGRRPYH